MVPMYEASSDLPCSQSPSLLSRADLAASPAEDHGALQILSHVLLTSVESFPATNMGLSLTDSVSSESPLICHTPSSWERPQLAVGVHYMGAISGLFP